MIDLILWAQTKADLATWGKTYPTNSPLLTANGPREGVSYIWWMDSGKFMLTAPVFDAEGTELVPATFAPGFVLLLRLHSTFFDNDKLSDDREGKQQWEYSKVAKWIKDNGTPGVMGRINYYAVGNVRIFRPADVEQYLVDHNLPGHTWVDGNSY